MFAEQKVTMREGLIRVLEQKVDPLKLKVESTKKEDFGEDGEEEHDEFEDRDEESGDEAGDRG